MDFTKENVSVEATTMANGSGAAAVLAAGIGCFAVGLIALMADKSLQLRSALIFYKPTGPLSGVTSVAIVVWLLCWVILDGIWKKKNVRLARINLAAFILLGLSVLLTFPPLADLL